MSRHIISENCKKCGTVFILTNVDELIRILSGGMTRKVGFNLSSSSIVVGRLPVLKMTNALETRNTALVHQTCIYMYLCSEHVPCWPVNFVITSKRLTNLLR